MSKNVDERIVQMSFDNSGFEKGVQETMSSLEKLSDSTEQFSQNVSKADLSPLAKGADEVKVKWSLLQSVMDGIGNRIGNSLVDVGMKALDLINPFDELASAVKNTFAIIESKGWARAANLENAKFKLEGILKTANAFSLVEEQINNAVLDTAYGMDAAANAAAQLATSGVAIKGNYKFSEYMGKEVDAMERALGAISGMASVTGDSYEHMADIFTDAAGQGKVSADTFNRIAAQGTNAAATMAEAMHITQAEVKDLASKGKISFQEFADAMYDAYYEQAKKSNETFDGSLANMKSALGQIGEKFATPIRKNMILPFNILKNILQAVKANIDPLVNAFDKVLQVGSRVFAAFLGYEKKVYDLQALKDFKTKATENLKFIGDICQGIVNIAKAIGTFLLPIGSALKALIPKDLLVGIPALAERFKEWTATLMPSQETLKNVRTVVYAVGLVIKSLIGIVGQLIAPLTQVNTSGISIVGIIGKAISLIVILIAKLLNWINTSGAIQEAISGVITGVEVFAGVITIGLTKAFDVLQKVFNAIRNIFSGKISVNELFKMGVNTILGFINGIQSGAANALSTVLSIFTRIVDAVKTFLGIHSPSRLFFDIAKNCFLGLINGFADGTLFTNLGSTIMLVIKGMYAIFVAGLLKLGEICAPVLKDVATRLTSKFQSEGATNILDFFGRVGSGIKEFVTHLDAGKIATIAFAVAMLGVIKVFRNLGKHITDTVDTFKGVAKSFTGVGDATKGFIDSLTYGVKKFTGELDDKKKTTINDIAKAILTFAGACAILTACLLALSFVPYDKLKQGAIALASIVGTLVVVTGLLILVAKAFNKFSSSLGGGLKSLGDKAFGDASAKLVKLAVSMVIMSAAILLMAKAFNSLDTAGLTVGEMLDKLAVLGIMMLELGAVAIVLSKTAPKLTKGSLFLLMFAGSVILLSKAFEHLPDISNGLIQLGIIAGALMGVGKLLSQGVTEFAKSMTVLATAALTSIAAIGLLALVIKFLNTYVPKESLVVGLLKCALIGAFVVALCVALQKIANISKEGSKIARMGGTLLAISVAMSLLGLVAAKIGAVPPEQMLVGVGVMAAFAMMMRGFMEASKFTDKSKMISFSAGMLLLTGCMIALAGVSVLIGLVDFEQLLKGAIVFTAFTIMVEGLMKASQFTEKANVKAMTTMLVGMFSLVALMIAMSLINDWPSVAKSILALGSVMILFAKTMEIIGRGTERIKGKSIAAMAVLILGMAEIGTMLWYLAQQDWKSLMASGFAMSITMLAFADLLTVISSRTGLKPKKIATVLLATLTLLPIAAALAAISNFDWKGMLAGGLAMSIVIFTFSKVLKSISASTGLKIDKIKSFLVASLSLLPIGAALAGLSFFDWSGMIGAGIGLAAAVSGLGLAMSFISGVRLDLKKIKSFVLASLAMVPIGAAIAIMTASAGGNLQSFIGAGTSLGIAINTLAIAMQLMSGVNINTNNVMNFVLASTAFIPIAMSLAQLTGFSWDGMASAVVGLTTCMLALVATLKIMEGLTVNPAQIASMVAASLMLIPIGMALSQVAGFSWDSILASGSAIGAVVLALSAALAIAAPFASTSVLGATALLLASLSLVPAAYALSQLAGFDWQSILVAAGALSGVALILTGIMALAGALSAEILIGAAALLAGAAAMAVMSFALKVFMPSLIQLIAVSPMLSSLGQSLLDLTPGLLAFSAACIVLSLATPGLVAGGLFLPSFAKGLILLGNVNDLTKQAVSIFKIGAACLVLGAAAPGMILASAGLLLLSVAFTRLNVSLIALSATFTLVLTSMQTVFTKFAATMTNTSKLIGVNVIKGMSNGITAGLPSIGKKAIQMGSVFLTNLRKKLGIHSPSKETKKDGRFTAIGFGEGATDGGIWGKIKSGWNKCLNEGILKVLKEVAEKVKNWFGSLGEKFGGLKDKLGDLGEGFEELKDGTFDLESAFGDFLDIEDTTKNLTDDLANAFGDVNSELGDIGKSGGSGEKAKSALEKLSETIAGQIDLFSEFSAKTELTSDKLLANMKSQIDGITNWANMMHTLGEKGIDKGLLAKLAEMGPQGYEYVNAFVNMTEEQMAQANEYYKQALVLPDSAARTALGKANKIGENVGQGLINGITSMQKEVNDVSTETGEGSLDALMDAYDEHSPSKKTHTIGQYADMGLINGINSMKANVIATMRLMGLQAILALKENLSVLKGVELGKFFTVGLAKGISENSHLATGASNSLGKEVVKSSAKGLQEKSPSRAAFKQGRFFDMGLANGIEAYSFLASDKAEEMGKGTIQIMKDVINKVTDSLNTDMDINPTITPVLDMSNIQNGGRIIAGMLNNGISVNAGAAAINSRAIKLAAGNGNIGGGNAKVASAVDTLTSEFTNMKNAIENMNSVTNTYQINGITYDDGSNISNAIETIVRATRIERRV